MPIYTIIPLKDVLKSSSLVANSLLILACAITLETLSQASRLTSQVVMLFAMLTSTQSHPSHQVAGRLPLQV
ncbi:MAG: hypothetical protein WAV05_14975 [Anaerolineales bacterium]